MRITYLVEDSSRIWGGVKAVFDAANALHARGHEVTIVSKSEPPTWMDLACGFVRSAAFAPEDIPQSDVVIATFWTTVPLAIQANRGAVVHYCQGYEGDNPESAPYRAKIEQIYRMEGASLVTISDHLQTLLDKKFGRKARKVTYAIDHTTMFAGAQRANSKPVRVGLIGPYEIAWKDIPTGIKACQLAAQAGLDVELVRVTNTSRHADEADLGIPVEWHENVPPSKMGEIYRSLDVFLGSSRGSEEGFFLPAIEAMACGVPAVLTEIPCFTGYGDKQYTLFVEAQNPAQMAEAMVIAAHHPQLRGELRQNGLDTAAQYTIDAHVSDLESAFAAIAAQSTPKAAPSTIVTPTTSRSDSLEIARAVRTATSQCKALDELEATAEELEGAVHAEIAHRRGLMLYADGDYRAAAETLRNALDGTTIPAEVYNDYGVAMFTCGDIEAARGAFERALQIDADHPDARLNLAQCTPSPAAT